MFLVHCKMSIISYFANRAYLLLDLHQEVQEVQEVQEDQEDQEDQEVYR